MKTDAALQLDVIAELKWEPSIKAASIGVEVKDGVVTLAGHVDTYAQKWEAERAAQRVAGVAAIAVEIDVKLAGVDERTDTDIARSASDVLRWSTSVPEKGVTIKVEDAWVTLAGEVEWEYQRQAATASVRNLQGVRGVNDRMTLRQSVSSTTIRSEIEAALRRRALDSHAVVVSVDGHEVTLGGSVHSWAERDLAAHSAWGTPGVRKVVDHLTIG